MTKENIKQEVQKRFGAHAQEYVTSTTHAKGYSLEQLVSITRPQSDWNVLDIATGGGHTALAFAPYVNFVVATDLTHPMLDKARRFVVQDRVQEHVQFCLNDAEHLPFASDSFDLVTSRIAPHHFPNVQAFVTESARVLRAGGILAVSDNVVSGEKKVGAYINAFEKLRDPSHFEAYTVDDWKTFMFKAGLEVFHEETFHKVMDFDPWAKRLGLSDADYMRVRVMLKQAPDDVKAWMRPETVNGVLTFKITEAIIAGRKL